ncbi:MAG: hypothetical protein KH031_10110 [Clostridiales bacterium]|nr:hypothetical protein [Clostridiales bacterium]
MALLTCPECEGKVSDQAELCPHCGFPIKGKEVPKAKMTKFIVCWHCGWIPDGIYSGHTPCNWCGHPYDEYESNITVQDFIKMSLQEQVNFEKGILENVIKKSPKFSQYALEKRLVDQEAYNKKSIKQARSGNYNSTPKVSCPFCKSLNTDKISTASRIASVGMLGLFSKKLGKQWHCNNCNSDF